MLHCLAWVLLHNVIVKKSVITVIIITILTFLISFELAVIWSDILEKLLGLTK